jgi:demethylmenaquinone methyltransferase / 2-methoxy-6-polyprenyl-1,4-benzoquinol methylase
VSGAVQTSTPGSAIRALFDHIASDYDRFNAWASLGLHQKWRAALFRRLPRGARVLDIATGTGDVALLAAQAGCSVVGLDFSERMLAEARRKDPRERIQWVNGSAEKLPFSDQSFDCVTSAFALRNLRGVISAVFAENLRVLRPGGKALHLDFGRPRSFFYRWGHAAHLRVGIPLIGRWVCGKRWPGGYLGSTIREFYAPEQVVGLLRQAGFSEARNIPLACGVVQLFEGIKGC